MLEPVKWTLEDLAALSAAIKTGARRIEYQDKTVEYRSLAEMLAIRRLMLIELGVVGGNSRRRYASVTKGVRT